MHLPARLFHRVATATLSVFLAAGCLLGSPAGLQGSTIPRHCEVGDEGTTQQSGTQLSDFVQQLDRRVPDLMARYDIPGVSIALVDDRGTVWARVYGFADRDAVRPMTLDSTYRVESISKAVTAWGVMRLVEQGRIGLDDPVQRHITRWSFPGSEFDWSEVTVRRLLNHTASLAPGRIGAEYEYAPEASRPSLEEALTEEVRLTGEPSSGFAYSNPGYNLLQLLVEEATGEPFAEYMEREILRPLGMDGASYRWTDAAAATIATGHDLQGEPVAPYVYAEQASGGLLATLEDVARFAAAGLPGAAHRGSVVSSEAISAIHAPGTIAGIYRLVADGYGLGHFVDSLPDDSQAVWVGGQGHGWMTDLHMLPDTGAAIVILTNSQRSWPMIAATLNDWTSSLGVPPVGLGRVEVGVTVMWIAIAALLLLAVALAGRVAHGLATGHRHFAPLALTARRRRLAVGAVGVGLALALWWAATRDYLFLVAVFPLVSTWLWFAVAAVTAAMLIWSTLPDEPRPKEVAS